jgi:hypothetical protein
LGNERHQRQPHDIAFDIADIASDIAFDITADIASGIACDIACDISNKGGILKFTFSGDRDSKPVTMETSMTEADFSGKGLGLSGAIMLLAFLPKCT